MRHDLTLTGPAFTLRPVTHADAAFILSLRTDPELSRYVNPTSPHLADQLAWLARYDERAGDYYFVIERRATGEPEGLIGVYDVQAAPDGLTAEWGRWMLRPGSMAAVESAWLIYACAFEHLGLACVVCRTVAENQRVVSFHDSCGITERRLLPGHVELGGRRMDSIEHRLTRAAWAEVGPRLQRLAELTARRLNRGT